MEFENICDKCDGSGTIEHRDGHGGYNLRCTNCGGRGKVLTERGGELLEFIKWHVSDYCGELYWPIHHHHDE